MVEFLIIMQSDSYLVLHGCMWLIFRFGCISEKS